LTSRAGYWLGAGLLVVAVVGAIAFAIVRIGALQDKIESFAQRGLGHARPR
jgi:hypothetical protein